MALDCERSNIANIVAHGERQRSVYDTLWHPTLHNGNTFLNTNKKERHKNVFAYFEIGVEKPLEDTFIWLIGNGSHDPTSWTIFTANKTLLRGHIRKDNRCSYKKKVSS